MQNVVVISDIRVGPEDVLSEKRIADGVVLLVEARKVDLTCITVS